MKIGHNRVLALGMIAAGTVSLTLGLVASTLSSVAVGGICCLVGVLYLMNPMAVITESEIQIRNPFGMTLKRIPFESKSALEVRDGKLYVAGQPKAAVGGFSVHGPDLEAVARWSQSA